MTINEQNGKLEKEYWENWLGDKDSKLSIDLVTIRNAVEKKYSNANDIALPFYTPHGKEHSEEVENLIHRLIPKEKFLKLKEMERFYLLASAWLHDVGMLRSISKEVWGKELDPSEIRKRHHITAQQFIINKYNEFGIEEKDKYFLAKLCRFHRKQVDINECDEELLVGNEKYKLRLLAAYLRLADALQIDSSRTPASAYAICLAYDIPSESKLHWIKSKLVAGVNINAENNLITVQFQIPNNDQLRDNNVDPIWVRQKIDSIIKHVMDDLRDELSSVMYILTRSGVSYYLDIEKVETLNYIDKQTLNDLLGLVMNYDILVAPSASKLLEMILVTIANISGYHVKKDETPRKFNNDINNNKITDDINQFLVKIEKNILAKRSCHLGLRNLIIKLNEATKDCLPENFECFIERINYLFQEHHAYRRKIKKYATSFFKDFIDDYNSFYKPSFIKEGAIINILLFGYSELVIKSICGFRDHLLRELNVEPITVRDSKLEKDISKRFRIFICEGQSKTHTAPRDRLLYHDGYSYAFALIKRNFTNLIVIPDIVVGNIIENNNINLVLVGANGFTNDVFKHSAGHGTVIKLIKEYNYKNMDSKKMLPKIILVVSTDKWSDKIDPIICKKAIDKNDNQANIDGYHFWKGLGNVPTRENFWITRDKNNYDIIKKNVENIKFYNPREDVIPIEYLDSIISDIGNFLIGSTDIDNQVAKIEAFFSTLKTQKPTIMKSPDCISNSE